ncbi:hypothetical protein M5689_006010 [Euphorbia peplus]|nr:hypothetical protein M5689_006010 [Euphorbia peplus]
MNHCSTICETASLKMINYNSEVVEEEDKGTLWVETFHWHRGKRCRLAAYLKLQMKGEIATTRKENMGTFCGEESLRM